MSLFGGITLPGMPSLENVRKLDLLPVPQLNRMSRYGIAVNPDYLRELSVEFGAEMRELEYSIASYIPPEALHLFSTRAAEIEEAEGSATINANSAEQIRTLLFDLLHVGRSQPKLKLTGTGKVSTGKKTLELVKEDHPVVQLVLDYRERSKLKSAFADALPQRAVYHPRTTSCPVCELAHVAPTWRLHTTFATTRAETGRLASRKPNLQQIPVRSELGARIRAAFIASPGCKLVSVDFAQAELRDLAHISNSKSMLKVYWEGGDIHTFTAMHAFGIDDPAKVDKIQHRLPSKNVGFGIVYGISAKGLQAQLATMHLLWTEERCEDFIQRYFNIYPEVRDYLDLQAYRARRYGFVWDPFGRVRRVPERMSTLPWIRAAGVRQAGNMPIQSCNAGQTKLVMAELEDEFLWLQKEGVYAVPLLPVHDQVIAEVEEEYAALVGEVMQRAFSRVMYDRESGADLWRVGMDADVEVMDQWVKT